MQNNETFPHFFSSKSGDYFFVLHFFISIRFSQQLFFPRFCNNNHIRTRFVLASHNLFTKDALANFQRSLNNYVEFGMRRHQLLSDTAVNANYSLNFHVSSHFLLDSAAWQSLIHER